MVEQEFVFDDAHTKPKKSALSSICSFIWNSNTKEFCGRDGASWGKVSLFYAVFYACLGSFFVGMLAVFVSFMPKDKPTYYGEASTMSSRGLNPGLGFRPQIDVEDSLIKYNPSIYDHATMGFKRYETNLKNFLDAKYAEIEGDLKNQVIQCKKNTSYVDEQRSGKSCEFDHRKVFAGTQCTKEGRFGYDTDQPCVLIKLNKIISWTPEVAQAGAIQIKCEGETSADKDNVYQIQYHSEGNLNADIGTIDAKFFPFMAQPSYRAPFVWAQIKVAPNTLVNIECRAIAANIDYDRMNRRGQTKFSLYISNTN